MEPDPTVLSAVIAGLYDAAVEPSKWPLALKGACGFVGGAQATLFWQGTSADAVGVFHHYNDDPVYTRLFLEKLAPLNPAFPAILFQEVGAVHTFGDLVPPEEERETVFYKEWVAPQGFTGSLAVVLERDAARLAILTFPWRGGAIDAAARQRLALLVPHVQRAVAIGQLFVGHRAETAALTETLAHVAEAVFLLADDGQVVFANARAREMLGQGAHMRLSRGRLQAVAEEADRILADSLRRSAGGAPASGLGTSFALEETAGERLTAYLLPLGAGEGQRAGGAAAALYVRRARFPDTTPLETLSKRFGLTASETRVVDATLRISGLDAIAAGLGVSKATVKTHLNRIYRKCEVRNQSGLIKLVAGLGHG